MQKIVTFLNKYAFYLNMISIVFWSYMIYVNLKQIQENNSFEERKNYFIVPVLFIILSFFNIIWHEFETKRINQFANHFQLFYRMLIKQYPLGLLKLKPNIHS